MQNLLILEIVKGEGSVQGSPIARKPASNLPFGKLTWLAEDL